MSEALVPSDEVPLAMVVPSSLAPSLSLKRARLISCSVCDIPASANERLEPGTIE